MKKLAIITSHPIQYNAPLFKLIFQRNFIEVKVFYTLEKEDERFDSGFDKNIKWDIPLLDGYSFSFVSNQANFGKGFWNVTNPSLIEEIKNFGADSILVFGWNYLSHLKAMRFFKGKIPVYFRGDSHLLDERSGIKKIFRRLFLRWVYSFIDIAIYVGQNNKAYFLAHGLSENQLIFAPHCIDNDRFIGSTNEDYVEKARKLRLQLGFNEEDIIIGFVAKLNKNKNPLLLLDAYLKINKLNIKLLFVGSGRLKPLLKDGVEDNLKIQFLDFQNQSMMPIIYRVCDVFVLPSSQSETWGLAINEAMACSKPVLVSDRCGCAIDLVKNGYNGYIFESGNVADLTQKIELIISSPSQLSMMGANSLDIIQKWTFELVCSRIEYLVINSLKEVTSVRL